MIKKMNVLSVRLSPADRRLIDKAAKLAGHRVSEYARGMLVTLAIWQLDETTFKLEPEHESLAKVLRAMGMRPARGKKRAVAA